MTPGDVLVGLNVALNTVASLCYAVDGRGNEALYWGAAAVISGTVLWRSL